MFVNLNPNSRQDGSGGVVIVTLVSSIMEEGSTCMNVVYGHVTA